MFTSIGSSASGLQQFQESIAVIGDNIANVNTVGFKGASATFQDALSQTVGSNSSGPMQVGNGVGTSSIDTLYTQGTVSETGRMGDVAISDGPGFFVVRNGLDGTQYATRNGNFHRDTSGYLVTASGLRVQGATDAAGSSTGDIQLQSAPTASGATYKSFSVDPHGKITVVLSDGTSVQSGQILLQDYQNPQALVRQGSGLYSNLAAAGPLAALTAPGSAGLGTLADKSLELSNVDLTAQFSNLIINQRAFQANARMLTTSDEILQEVVNLKH